ncbi:MAG TPA: hypothetical protein VGR96_13535 [Acidobacteriaceae bacterium]|nr:hypothetical protein [Acidobacteriaceae bacterium]
MQTAIGLLFLGSVFVGALTVLLGCVLPRLSAIGHLRDQDAGALLMVQFAFAAGAALLVRRNFHWTLVWGYALIALAVLALHLLPKALAIPIIAAYGLGLGLVMTSNSMLVGRIFPGRRGVAIASLNLCWSLGAALTPWLIARTFDLFSVSFLTAIVAVTSALFAAVPFLGGFQRIIDVDLPVEPPAMGATPAVAYFGLLAFLYVGIESATGNWMSSYALRVSTWDLSRSNLATACFWTALLLGRMAAPLILLAIAEERLYLLSACGAVMGGFVLVAAHSGWLVLLGAVLSGLSLAPIFSLIVALFMARAGQPRSSGWVFAVAASGGAFLPWLTGIVSSAAGSLRIGMLVPACSALLLLLLGSRLNSAADAGAPGSLRAGVVPGRG